MAWPYEFRIGTSVAGLAYLPLWGIAWPDTWTYTPWAVMETRGDMHRVGFGFPRTVWGYDNMGQGMLYRFLRLFGSDDDASVETYISTYKDTEVRLNVADFAVIMHRPIDGDGKILHARVRPNVAAYSNVKIEFTGLEEQ